MLDLSDFVCGGATNFRLENMKIGDFHEFWVIRCVDSHLVGVGDVQNWWIWGVDLTLKIQGMKMGGWVMKSADIRGRFWKWSSYF